MKHANPNTAKNTQRKRREFTNEKKNYKDFPHVIYLNRNMNTVIMEQQIFTVGSYMKRFGLDVSQLTALKKERNVCAQTK